MLGSMKSRLGGAKRSSPPDLPRPDLPRPDPTNIVSLIWRLSDKPKQAITVVLGLGVLMIIATFCFRVAHWESAVSAKGVKGIPQLYVLTLGAVGSSILTLVTTRVAARIKGWRKASRADEESERRQDGNG